MVASPMGSRAFQNIRLFGQLTVWQNLWVAENAETQTSRSGFLAMARRRQRRPPRITKALEFSGLADKATSWPAISRSASSAASSLHARWPRSPGSFSSMSPPPA